MLFLRSAKTGRNTIFGPVIGSFVVVEMLFWADGVGWTAEQRGTTAGLGRLGLLLFAMGGRFNPAGTTGEPRQRGGILVRLAQPRLEWPERHPPAIEAAAPSVLTIVKNNGAKLHDDVASHSHISRVRP